ncbi:MAG: gliding motility-associated C-terminal domain-containing protein [Flavobacteriales bacterium]|nr:gliding motility-associated C-terminal domain-containing protein [Flavobacteriales bacterium]
MKNLILVFAATILSSIAVAQEYPVSNPSITDCGGFLVDAGFSASDYGPNENFTSVICHDGTDDPIVNLYFSFFELGTGDEMSIYDGSSTASPLIGTYIGMELQAQDITSTNGDGCLTVVFTSNGDASVGSFGAEISCGLPCAKPFSIITTDEVEDNPIKVCVGEEIVFDGAASTFAEGAILGSFQWNFDDGLTDNANWPNVTHSFAEPGAYVVQLYLIDDNDCANANLPDRVIFVSTTPEITVAADDYQVCIGQEVDITGLATPVMWSALPDVDFGGGLYIPDDQSQCFSDVILFGGFTPGEVIDDVSDFEYFFINFEHTFMGDLVISFICPNGQSIAVHQQGGGGTHLGVSNELDDQNLPGEGWDYYWSPDAVNGTWEESSQDANLLVDNGNFNMALMSGFYQSSQSWDQLIGCPLNGEWTVEVCDMWGADDGFIFDWSVQFAPELYPDLISFTPSIGQGCDSTFWAGSFITQQDAGCDTISIIPTAAGTFSYVYTAIDDFGCTYSAEIAVEAYPGPVPSAGADVPYCLTEMDLEASVGNEVQGINYIYNWIPGGPITGDNTLTPTITNLNEDTEFIFSVYPQNDPQCLVVDTVLVYIPEPPAAGPLDSLQFCAGDDALLTAPFQDNSYTYNWYYSLDDIEDYEWVGTSSTHAGSTTGYYYVEAAESICGFTSETPFYLDVISCNIVIPNVFSPNNDSQDLNNSLVFTGLEYFEKSTLRVYNRWGNLIYESDNYKNNWTPAEEEAPEGTYFFILGVNKNSNFEYYEGHLTLLRKAR